MDPLLAIATLGPVGYAPFSGTLASLIAFIVLYPFARLLPFSLYVGLVGIGLIVGYFSIKYALNFFKHRDPSIVVYDEVMGVMVLLCLIPLNFVAAFVGFWLFRVFDGSKVLGVSLFEKIKGVWGVILDDIASALYAVILIRLSVYYGFL